MANMQATLYFSENWYGVAMLQNEETLYVHNCACKRRWNCTSFPFSEIDKKYCCKILFGMYVCVCYSFSWYEPHIILPTQTSCFQYILFSTSGVTIIIRYMQCVYDIYIFNLKINNNIIISGTWINYIYNFFSSKNSNKDDSLNLQQQY